MVKFMNLVQVKIRIMLRHWSFLIMYLLLCGLTLLLITGLYNQANQGFEIPVGFVDLDKSDFSETIIHRMQENLLVDVLEYDEASGLKAVENHQVEVLYTIVNGAYNQISKGDFDDLFIMTYLDGNYFASMISDIFAGEYLDEISLHIASDYYARGHEKYVDDAELSEENKVYEIGKSIELGDRESHFISIELLNDGEKIELEWYNQSILFEKMTIGIIYVFASFFIMFSGSHIVRDRASMVYQKVRQTGVSKLAVMMSEYMTLVIGGILILLPLTLVSVYYGKELKSVIVINALFIIGTSGLIYMFLHFFKHVMLYTLIGTGLIVGVGIVSGSFFSIDTLSEPLAFIARLFPNFYSIQSYFDNGFIKEYSVYTVVYIIGCFSVCGAIDYYRTAKE